MTRTMEERKALIKEAVRRAREEPLVTGPVIQRFMGGLPRMPCRENLPEHLRPPLPTKK